MVKIISLSEEAYSILKKHKKKKMSFSDVIIKKFSEKKEKKYTLSDLINFVEKQRSSKRKEDIAGKHDLIAHGVER